MKSNRRWYRYSTLGLLVLSGFASFVFLVLFQQRRIRTLELELFRLQASQAMANDDLDSRGNYLFHEYMQGDDFDGEFVPMMIRNLLDSSHAIRGRANEKLVARTKQDFGFDPNGDIKSRFTQVREWISWYLENAP